MLLAGTTAFLLLAGAAQYPIPAPGTGVERALPLSPEQRAQFEEAMKARDYTRAETLLVGAIDQNPESPHLYALYTLVGGVFFMDGKHLNAAIAFKKAEKIEPLDATSRFTLAMAYVSLGRRDWARPELETLAEANPDASLYVYWLARLDYDDQKFAAAVEKLNRAISLTPDFMRAHDNLGLCLEALGKYDEASRSYEKANELNRLQKPSSPWPPLNYGVMLLKLGKHGDAEPYLRESLRYNPGFAEAHYRFGMLLEKKGNVAEAIKEQTEAASLDVEYPEPEYALARLYRQAGDMEKAKIALQEFQKRKRQKEEKRPVSGQRARGEKR